MSHAKIKIEMLKFANILDNNEQYDLSDVLTEVVAKSHVKKKYDVKSKQAQALFAFMGWLTSREEKSGPFSSTDDAAQAADLVAEFCKSQGWDISDWEDNWIDKFKPYPKKKKKRKRLAWVDNDDIMHCDNCDIDENEADISYEEFCDKHLCDDCRYEEEQKWGDHQEFLRWRDEREREEQRTRKKYDNSQNNDNSGFINLRGWY